MKAKKLTSLIIIIILILNFEKLFAASTDTATVSAAINSGPLSVTVAESSISFSKTLDGNDYFNTSANGGLSITATDATGTGNGWNLTVANDGTDFISGPKTIANSNFKFNSGGISITMISGLAIDPINGPIADTVASGTFSAAKKFTHVNPNYGLGKYSVIIPSADFTLDITA
ncbi:MAG: hypothetical protein HYU63_00610, partial [Armatimonadetes bacterium]|nr:hypothetical protein [Armatimonadota bacterium]